MATLSRVFPASATPGVKEASLSKAAAKGKAAAAPPANADEQAEAALTAFDLDTVRRYAAYDRRGRRWG
jgi:hypothetical protein